jgi:AraC-like DNA-binding protein/mannose-6-phosphate isomerase-like protein (cupin superfamily)
MEDGQLATWFRYLPVTKESREWGFYVIDTGYTLIPPGTVYPPGKHPGDHAFTWEEGRTLPSYTLVYITRGAGCFESATAGQKQIKAGDVFIVFPGEWHRYRPDPGTGWDEYWVEFDGDHARHIMKQRDLSKSEPVLAVSHHEAIVGLFLDMTDLIRQGQPGFEHIIATQAGQIVARVLAAHRHRGGDSDEAALVRRACVRILELQDRQIDFGALAFELGMSQSGFRKKFRRITGMPPGQYLQQLRLNRAYEWLQHDRLTITEIAAQLGFESVFYFSRLFKRKFQMSPSGYRSEMREAKTKVKA